MHRRSVLKGLAALPFVGLLNACDDDSNGRRSNAGIVEVHLDGAFALVIQENKGNSLVAFSPRPKTGEEQHQFYLNGSTKPEDTGKTYHFSLAPEGVRREKKPEINPGLNDFFFHTDNWRIGNSLVTIELPAPKRITFSGHRSPVTFVGGRQAFMPTNHILEYDVEEPRRLKLDCKDGGVLCAPDKDSFPGVTRFFFEVGPQKTLDYAASHAHALRFFNEILDDSFPDLAQKFKLVIPEAGRDKQSRLTPQLMPAVFHPGAQGAQLREASYIIDCEFAGPMVGASAGPRQP